MFSLVELLERLNADFLIDGLVNFSFGNELITDKLTDFSDLFSELHQIKKAHPELKKKINGSKGQVIYRMSANETLATQLLAMPTPFFSKNSTIMLLSNNVDKVKAIAQTYLMRGEKYDRVQGSLLTYSLFKEIKESKGTLITQMNQIHPH